MSTLRKYFNIDIIPGKPGIPGVAAVPGRAGYWSYRTVRTTPIKPEVFHPGGYTISIPQTPETPPPNPLAGSGQLTQGQNVRKATQAELYWYFPELRPFFDRIQDAYDNDYDTAEEGSPGQLEFQAAWDAYSAKVTSMLQAEINTGTLGRPMVNLSHTYGELGTAYIGTWDEGSGVWFFVFTGITDQANRPWMAVVPE